jgi:hypothetical protein
MKNRLVFPGLMCGLGLLGLSGCETVIDVDTPPHTPRLALSYTLSNMAPTADNQDFFSIRGLFVSTSQSVLDTKELQGRGDATVQLLDEGGQVVEIFRSKARPGYGSIPGYPGSRPDSVYGYYVPVRGFVGVPGRTYTLRAAAPGVESVESTLTLPATPVIETAGYVAKAPNSNGNPYQGYTGRFTLQLTDNKATVDYYMVYVRVLDQRGNYWGTATRDYSTSPDSGPEVDLERFQVSESDSYYNQYPYSDVSNSGPQLGLGADVQLHYRGAYDPYNPAVPAPGYLEVIVSGVTPDTYRYYQSLGRYNNTDGNPFAEPAPLYSNVRPGYGLFGGATDAVYRLKL